MNELPADRSRRDRLGSMLRVNHAGEYGAARIYAGQMAVLKDNSASETIRHMAEQEAHHLAEFNRLIPAYAARPSALIPLWHVAGWALGAGTALLGKQAAMACTVAVETVIAEHYQEQLDTLGEQEPELAATIAQFRAEELEHHDIGLEQGAELAPAYGLLTTAIKTGCRAAIAIAKRV